MLTVEQRQTLKDAMALLSKEDHNGPGIITYTRAERQTLIEAFVLLRNQAELFHIAQMTMPGAGSAEMEAWKSFSDTVALVSPVPDSGKSQKTQDRTGQHRAPKARPNRFFR